MDTISHTAIWETALEVYQAEYGDEGTYDGEIEAIPTKELEESDYKNLRLAVDAIDILSKRLARSQKKLSETIKSNKETEKELVAQRHDAEHLQGLVQAENDHLIDENRQLKAEVQHAIGAVAEQPPIAEMSAEDALDLAVNTIKKRLTIEVNNKLIDENKQLKAEVAELEADRDRERDRDEEVEADFDALEIACDILRDENECNKKNFLKTLDENKKLTAEKKRFIELYEAGKLDTFTLDKSGNVVVDEDDEMGVHPRCHDRNLLSAEWCQ